jgi:hypothetical protein
MIVPYSSVSKEEKGLSKKMANSLEHPRYNYLFNISVRISYG